MIFIYLQQISFKIGFQSYLTIAAFAASYNVIVFIKRSSLLTNSAGLFWRTLINDSKDSFMLTMNCSFDENDSAWKDKNHYMFEPSKRVEVTFTLP